MPESPKLNVIEGTNTDAFSRWVELVNQEEPMSADAELACKIIKDYLHDPRTMRAFWHENYGQWWVHLIHQPGHQMGHVTQAAIDEYRAQQAA